MLLSSSIILFSSLAISNLKLQTELSQQPKKGFRHDFFIPQDCSPWGKYITFSVSPPRSISNSLQATGNLGSNILAALNAAGFSVTAIQRANSTNVPQGAAHSIKVDLSSQSALTSAFKDQDVVVSSLPDPKLESDKIWIQAAIAAGVKRIFLSEFSTNMDNKLAQKLPIIADKLEIRKYVEGLAKDGKIEWGSVNNGPFMLQFIYLGGMFGPNMKNRTATLHDGGERWVCTSTLDQVSEAVAQSLKPEYAGLTKNKPAYIYSTTLNERKVVDIVSKISGIKFQEKNSSVDEVTKAAFEAYEKGDKSKMMSFYLPLMIGEGYGGDFRQEAWNEKLGLKDMSDSDVEDLFKSWLKKD